MYYKLIKELLLLLFRTVKINSLTVLMEMVLKES